MYIIILFVKIYNVCVLFYHMLTINIHYHFNIWSSSSSSGILPVRAGYFDGRLSSAGLSMAKINKSHPITKTVEFIHMYRLKLYTLSCPGLVQCVACSLRQKSSSDPASATVTGSVFQSLMILGKNELLQTSWVILCWQNLCASNVHVMWKLHVKIDCNYLSLNMIQEDK